RFGGHCGQVGQGDRSASPLCWIRRRVRPHESVKLAFAHVPHDRSVVDGRLDLCAVANNPWVGHELLDLFWAEAGNTAWVKLLKNFSKMWPLAQDRDPRQSCLESLERQLLKYLLVTVEGMTPLLVVI